MQKLRGRWEFGPRPLTRREGRGVRRKFTNAFCGHRLLSFALDD